MNSKINSKIKCKTCGNKYYFLRNEEKLVCGFCGESVDDYYSM